MEPKILIIDDEQNMCHMLSSVLQKEGFRVFSASSGEMGVEFLKKESVEIVLCDLKMPGMDGLEVLERVFDAGLVTTMIMMSAYATVDTAVKAMKLGAYDFITKPFKTEEILCVLKKALERDRLKSENEMLRSKVEEFERAMGFDSIITENSTMKNLIQFAKRAAIHDTTVLITGESGTGKELFAKGIQLASPRSARPFISINCGAVPESLLESEFFGHRRGAFTGAETNKTGIFEDADSGTLFLDEIGELTPPLQVKLLRVLQEQEIRPVGSSTQKKVNVRVIAATARDLSKEVERRTFRQDLLFRLNVVELKIPPLRERSEDIPLLVQHFIGIHNKRLDRKIDTVRKEVMPLLLGYHWPGNVRELENIIERAVVYSEGKVLSADDLPDHINTARTTNGNATILDHTYSMKEGKKIMERCLIVKALEQTGGNKSQAAQLLEISYPSLLSKIKELGL